MSSVEPLPPEVVSFARTHLRSLNDLTALIQCVESTPRWWDAGTLARDTGLSASDARRSLDHLARGNLLDIKITGDVRYAFSPGTDVLRDLALAFVAAFRSRPAAVLQLVAGSGRPSVRDFADAFRIRRDDDS